MAYTIPTPAVLKAQFPAFTAVADDTVQIWIDRAASEIDTSWLEADYTFAIELLACHYMVTLAGLGTGAQAKAVSAGMDSLGMIRSGNLTLQANASSQNASVPSPWGSTFYGRTYYSLLRRNRPAVAVAVAPFVPDTPLPAGWPGPWWY